LQKEDLQHRDRMRKLLASSAAGGTSSTKYARKFARLIGLLTTSPVFVHVVYLKDVFCDIDTNWRRLHDRLCGLRRKSYMMLQPRRHRDVGPCGSNLLVSAHHSHLRLSARWAAFIPFRRRNNEKFSSIHRGLAAPSFILLRVLSGRLDHLYSLRGDHAAFLNEYSVHVHTITSAILNNHDLQPEDSNAPLRRAAQVRAGFRDPTCRPLNMGSNPFRVRMWRKTGRDRCG
jgi:hypothetical protein